MSSTTDHDFVVRVDRHHGVDVLSIGGEIDLLTEHHLRPALARALAGTGSALVLDLTGLDFCSVHGMRLLADITATLTHRGVAVAVAGMSRLQARTWALSGLPVPDRYDTVAQALPGLARPAPAAQAGEQARVRHAEEELRGLHQAMAADVSIEQAKGRLMEQYGCTAAQAFELLTEIAAWSHRTAHDIARDLSADVADPAQHTGEPKANGNPEPAHDRDPAHQLSVNAPPDSSAKPA